MISPIQQESAQIVASLRRIEWLLVLLFALGLVWFFSRLVWWRSS